jgi:hypothetical protein
MLNSFIILQHRLDAAMNFENEIEKLPVSTFSVLKLDISPRGHVYGAFLLRLFGVPHIQNAIKSLKVILPWDEVNFHDAHLCLTYILFAQNPL